MTDKEFFNYCIGCGWDELEALQKVKDREIFIKLYFTGNTKEPRDITSSTYERAQKRLDKEITQFIGNRR